MTKTVLWLKTHLRVILAISVIIACAPGYLRAYSISPGGVSEVPTILPGDTVVFNMAAYDLRLPYTRVRILSTGSPQRGDMVLITVPTSGWPAPKRVIAIPGDTVEVRENQVFINDRLIEAKPLDHASFRWVPETAKLGSAVADEGGHWISYSPGIRKRPNIAPILLAADQYYLLGDNRDESADSRDWGPLSKNSILGKMLVVFRTGRRL